MRAEITRRLGAPGIIVNNAVIQYQWTSVLEQSIEDYEGQFRSCVSHNVLMAQTFVPAMIEAQWGRVIAINTECAMQNFPTQSAYVAGKRGKCSKCKGVVSVPLKDEPPKAEPPRVPVPVGGPPLGPREVVATVGGPRRG